LYTQLSAELVLSPLYLAFNFYPSSSVSAKGRTLIS
jgi:hypothetical protein